MKQGSVPLLIVFVVCAIISGLIASDLHSKQAKIAPSRSSVSKAPLAGFQKFASDIEWMRFIQYCGGIDSVTDANVPEINRRVRRIVALDPDFGRAYYEGALILSVKAPDKALDILDKGMENPALSKMWKLPLLAGAIVMRPEMDKYYKGQTMNSTAVKRAKEYYRQALKCPGRPKYTINCVIRAESALLEGDAPKEVKELEVWFDYWKKSYTVGDMMDAMGGGMGDELMGYGPGSTDTRQALINALLKARAMYPDHPTVVALNAKVLEQVFTGQHVDPDTLRVYAPGDRFSPATGKPLAVYGVCSKCQAVLKGPFCHACGTKNDEAWADATAKAVAGPPAAMQAPAAAKASEEKAAD